MTDRNEHKTIGILGGTGPLGRGLAWRWSNHGRAVIIGSRDLERARTAAEEIDSSVAGLELEACARAAEIVVLAVPWSAHAETLQRVRHELAGKTLVDAVVPLAFDRGGPYALAVDEGSAAQQAQRIVPDARVVAAFHHMSAVTLADRSQPTIDADVMIVGDDTESVHDVQELAEAIPGLRGVYAGRLRNARQVEALTANLIAVNKRYKTHAGIAVTGVAR